MSVALPRGLPAEPNRPEVEAAFEAVPPEMVAEILDGELFTFPRPARPHTRGASRLGMKLGGPFDLGEGGPGGWVILDEPELHLGPRPDKLAPDLAGWRRERMPDAIGDEVTPSFYDAAPDWVCEVISPPTERVDRGKKMRIYRREGVGHVWLLSPLLRTLEVDRLESGRLALLETYEDDALPHRVAGRAPSPEERSPRPATPAPALAEPSSSPATRRSRTEARSARAPGGRPRPETSCP